MGSKEPSGQLELLVDGKDGETDLRGNGVLVTNVPPRLRSLEGTVEDVLPVVNDMKAYGLSLSNLQSFLSKSKPNYKAAQLLFYGLMDVEAAGAGVPREIYQAMNTSEIAAMFVGIALLKRADREYSKLKDRLRLGKIAVEDIISKLVQMGYRWGAVRAIEEKGFNKHPTKSGDLKRRIMALPYNAKEMFLLPFNRTRVVSNADNPEMFGFYDPNSDGKLDRTAAMIYIRGVSEHMNAVYNRSRA